MRLILSAALAATVSTAALAQAIDAGKVVTLSEWSYDDLYAGGWSVEDFIDEMDVVTADGDDIGDVEDVIFGGSGQILSVVIEAGGFLDIGDTHISVPWDQVTVQGETVIVPVTAENLADYDYFQYSGMAGGKITEDMIRGVDDMVPGMRAWRASELIGDYARLRDGDSETNYGYVDDLIVRDGKIAATVVDPGTGFGTGSYAYPYYGYGYGWEPGSAYYDMPYSSDEVGEMDPFDYELIEG